MIIISTISFIDCRRAKRQTAHDSRVSLLKLPQTQNYINNRNLWRDKKKANAWWMICKLPYIIKLKQNICNNYQNVSKHFQRQWQKSRDRDKLVWKRKRKREKESPSAVQEKHCYDYCSQTEKKSHSQKCFLTDTQWKNKNH